MFIWITNLVIVLCCLVKLVNYMDPLRSTNTADFWKLKECGDKMFDMGNMEAAYSEYMACLKSLEIILPTCISEFLLLSCWQLLRLVIFRNKIFRYSENGMQRDKSFLTARDLALFFSRLSQLNLLCAKNYQQGLNVSFYTLEMAQRALGTLNSEELVTIYITSALHVKRSYPRTLKFVIRYYIEKARRERVKNNKDEKLHNWIFTPLGFQYVIQHDFYISRNMRADDCIFTQLSNSADPLSYLLKDYQEYLIHQAIQCLVGSTCKTFEQKTSNCETYGKNDRYRNDTVTNIAMRYITLLLDSFPDENRSENMQWWVKVLEVSVSWLLGEDSRAIASYQRAKTLPISLKSKSDGLPKALQLAMKAKYLLLQ